MDVFALPANEYRRERWKNGAGWTREILRWPRDAEDWDWRLSIAEVDKDGPFSAFAGVDRELVLLAGEGMRLRFDDGEVAELQPPHDRVRFAGERSLHCELFGGPTQDFNLMWKRDRIEAQLLHRPLVGPMLFFAEAGVHWAIYVLAGRAAFKDRKPVPPLEQGDTALIDASGAGRVLIDGGGELLLVRLRAI
jgi:uncharacterized protein